MVFGSAIGSIMVANVLFVIIPGQRELVRAKQQGRAPDPAAALRGKQRSVHNTYFTLPVLFVMISNHYAITFGARYNWLVLIAISFAGACLRAWFVARHRAAERGGHVPALPMLLACVALAAVVIALAPAPGAALRASRRWQRRASCRACSTSFRYAACHATLRRRRRPASAPRPTVWYWNARSAVRASAASAATTVGAHDAARQSDSDDGGGAIGDADVDRTCCAPVSPMVSVVTHAARY